MKYMKLYGSMAGDEHTDVARLCRRIERYRRACVDVAAASEARAGNGCHAQRAGQRCPSTTICCEAPDGRGKTPSAWEHGGLSAPF